MGLFSILPHNPSGYTSKTLKIQRKLLWKVCKHQTLKGSRLQENTILMQHNLPLRFGGLFLRKFIKDKQEVWKRWWASGGLRGRRQASRLFIGSGDMITSKSSQHFVGVCSPCTIKSHNKLEGNRDIFLKLILSRGTRRSTTVITRRSLEGLYVRQHLLQWLNGKSLQLNQ